MEHPPKQGLKLRILLRFRLGCNVLMEHPPKQGLKRNLMRKFGGDFAYVLMEHPPKQGLKQVFGKVVCWNPDTGFNGTSTKTRIETTDILQAKRFFYLVLMEHPPKQGLKR